jgi:hypothetical protein
MDMLLDKTVLLKEYIDLQQKPFFKKLSIHYTEEDKIDSKRFSELRYEIEDAAMLIKRGDQVIYNLPGKDYLYNLKEGIVEEVGVYSIKIKDGPVFHEALIRNGIERICCNDETKDHYNFKKRTIYVSLILIIILFVGIATDIEELKYGSSICLIVGFFYLANRHSKKMEVYNRQFQNREMRRMQAKAMEVEVGLRKIADETYNIMQKNIREIERNSSEAKDM